MPSGFDLFVSTILKDLLFSSERRISLTSLLSSSKAFFSNELFLIFNTKLFALGIEYTPSAASPCTGRINLKSPFSSTLTDLISGKYG